MHCPFCQLDDQRILFRHALGLSSVVALWDQYPVSTGHLLLIPERHTPTWFDATAQEQQALTSAIEIAKTYIEARHQPHGYNIGINVGPAAGQTVPHLHVHLIPRYSGDTPDPRGGVRHVIPQLANYLAERPPEFVINKAQAPQRPTSPFVRGEFDPLLPHLKAMIDGSKQADFSVAFIKQSGVELLRGHMQDLLNRQGRVRIITGDYLDGTEPEALEDLLELGPSLELYVVECTPGMSFHPKAYLFHTTSHSATSHSATSHSATSHSATSHSATSHSATGHSATSHSATGHSAYIGSSNLSRMALQTGIEWNYRVDQSVHGAGFSAMADAFEQLLQDPRTKRIDAQWIDRYRARRREPLQIRFELDSDPSDPVPDPHAIQREALTALAQTRLDGNRAGLVVLATGLGKTYLAAFDAASKTQAGAYQFPRVLFVAHRDEILHQSMRTFRKIRPESHCGRYQASHSDAQLDRIQMLFASIQTLGRVEHLKRFAPDAFDYIVVDEFHHAAASTYRRLLDHFQPKFLLGLTATPERTDGGDLLGLCQENLVYRCDLIRGIDEELLSPFEYFGVPDEVDYSNIPWRSRRFDEAALTTAVSTHARAQNALEQLRRVGAKRTLGFCCSQQHADFMAEYFRGAGLRVASVHSGSESDPRSRSLEALGQGDLDIVFAVDMFNEGLDIPSIDTVLMLRPTESSILWLQQFGRGLRKSPDKPCLKVVDYIGNHRTFLVKLRSMLQPLLRVGESDSEIRRGLQILQQGEAQLPAGCSVTYDLATIDLIEQVLRPASRTEAMNAFYRDFEERHDQRPTALESYHAGYNPRALRATHGSWYGYVAAMGGLQAEDRAAWEHQRAFFEWVEITAMNKSYKMLVLLSLLQSDLQPSDTGTIEIGISAMVQAVRRMADRSAALRADLGEEHFESDAKLRRHLESNPIKVLTKSGSARRNAALDVEKIYFKYREGIFRWVGGDLGPHRDRFAGLLRELVDWRLAEYLDRAKKQVGNRCRIISSGGRPIIKLPSRTGGANPPSDWVLVEIDGNAYAVKFAQQYINVVRETQESTVNILGDILRSWYGPTVGQAGTRFEVQLVQDADGWHLRKV
jgi:superfamily II DNA or RNA helicase/diadenosine tetraphosphate (Ap4A) HIT family hydrolase